MQFKDIAGQAPLCNHLSESIDAGRVSHTQLFCGPTASGSLALALAYLQYLNCQARRHYDSGELRADSCGECHSCKKIQSLTHSDLHLYFPSATTGKVKSNPSSAEFQEEFRNFIVEHKALASLDEWYGYVGIEKTQGLIRERDADNIVRTLAMKSYEGGYKMAVLWMAEKMNEVAANKLLKTLEEPSDNTILLLVAEDKETMLDTVISRTQITHVPPLSHAQQWPSAFASTFVEWMRLLFKLNMATLSKQVDKISLMNREQLKQFLQYSLETIRLCFMQNAAGMPVSLGSGDAKFDAAFPSMVTQRNVEGMTEALGEALYAIERNASSKITFMQLSFTLSKLIKNR